MGKPVNLPVPVLGKWRKLQDSKDIYDVLGYLIQIPLQILFMLGTLCLALQITWRKVRPLRPAKTPIVKHVNIEEIYESPREITLKELRRYDGIQKDKIYVAVNHQVFDVTSAWEYFGPEGPDSSLAGRDASRTLVTLISQKDNSKMDSFSDFNSMQLDYLFELETQYRERYNYVGYLVEKTQPKQLQKSCIEVIRSALQRRNPCKTRKDQVSELPVPKRIQREIVDIYTIKTN